MSLELEITIMKLRLFAAFSISLTALSLVGASLSAAEIDSLQRGFVQPPDDARIMARWWWFGPAVTKSELERELNTMKQGGFGGAEVQATYPLSLDNAKLGIKNFKFLSPEHLDCLKFTAAKAKELGLRMDLTLGSGWPYGGSMFSSSEAAGRIQSRRVNFQSGQTNVPSPALRAGERIIAAYLGPVEGAGNPFTEIPVRDGAARLPAGTRGPGGVTFCVAGQTGMKVKRPAYGAEGFVIDHYNPAVIAKFIEADRRTGHQCACGANPPYAVFCDSLEVGGEDWTCNFLAEFQKRRRYDLRPFLPALFNNIGPKTADIRHDWGQTLTELFNDYFVSRLEQWATDRKTRFRIQAYGTPPAALYSATPCATCPKAKAMLGTASARPAGPPRPATCWEARSPAPRP